jgi:cAMP-dependent protein kinase regulator
VDHRNLHNALKGNFLFQVDAEEMDILLDAFEPWEVGEGTTVITQGDVHANYFYVVSDGSVDIHVNEQLVTVLGKGNSFGELALLYDAPRAATVKVSHSITAKLWRLDRQTFKKILVNVHARELKQRVKFLSQVPILASLSELETKQLAEGMNSVLYEAGKKIINVGEEGGTFFIVASGEVQFLNEAGAEISARGTTGSYFGEVALLQNDRRSCNVVSTQQTKCLVIDRKHFRYLIGSLELLLRRNMDVYSKFTQAQKS